jgi:hypothetical protein
MGQSPRGNEVPPTALVTWGGKVHIEQQAEAFAKVSEAFFQRVRVACRLEHLLRELRAVARDTAVLFRVFFLEGFTCE